MKSSLYDIFDGLFKSQDKDSSRTIILPVLLSSFFFCGKYFANVTYTLWGISGWNNLYLLLWLCSCALLSLGWFLFWFFKIKNRYWKPVKFHNPVDRNAVLGEIFDLRKAGPEFASELPELSECGTALSILKKHNHVWLKGRSGDGKSSLAYHVAKNLADKGLHAYELCKKDGTPDKLLPSILAELSVLERLPFHFSRTIILIDDCHLDLQKALAKELANVKDGAKYIFIETDTEQYGAIAPDPEEDVVRIDLSKNIEAVRLFHESSNNNNDAHRMATANQIANVWHYGYVATRAWNKILAARLDTSAKWLIYFLSIKVITTGLESHAAIPLQEEIIRLKTPWIDNPMAFDAAINALSNERLIETNSIANQDIISFFHYNSAFYLAKYANKNWDRHLCAAALKAGIGVATLDCRQLFLLRGTFYDYEDPSRLPQFDTAHYDCLKTAITKVTENDLGGAISLLRRSIKREIIASLTDTEIMAMAVRLSKTKRFGTLADWIAYLYRISPEHAETFVNSLEIQTLVANITGITAKQFHGLARLLTHLESRWADFTPWLEASGFRELARAAACSDPEHWQGLGELIMQTNKHYQNRMPQEISNISGFTTLAAKAVKIETLPQIHGLTLLLRNIDDVSAAPFRTADFSGVATAAGNCGTADIFGVLITLLKSKKLDATAISALKEALVPHLIPLAEIIQHTDTAKLTINNYTDITRFIGCLDNPHRDEFVTAVTAESWERLCTSFNYFDSQLSSLHAFGACLKNYCFTQPAPSKNVIDHLLNNTTNITDAISNKVKNQFGNVYSEMASFLYGCDRIESTTAKILAQHFIKMHTHKMSTIHTPPTDGNKRSFLKLVRTLVGIDRVLAETFINPLTPQQCTELDISHNLDSALMLNQLLQDVAPTP